MKTAMNNISLSGTLKEKKTHSQEKSTSKDKKTQAQTELIEQQKREIAKLKAVQATGVSLQQFVNAIMQAMPCLYMGNKKTPPSTTNSDKKFMGTPRPPKPSAGVDGFLDNNLMCWYCRDTRHELDNCKWLQNKLAHDHEATWSIVTEESLNTKHH